MNKKIIALVLAALMMFSLVACGGNSDTTTTAGEGDTTAADATASDLAYVQEKGTLVVGMTEYAPMNYKEEGSDEWTGFDTEFAQAFAKEIGVEVEFVEIDWDNKFTELEAKSLDCIWNGMTITDEALANSSVSDPYVKNAQVVVMAKDKLDSYKDADSIKDLSFAVEAGSAGEQEVKNLEIANVTAVKTQSDALLEVKSGSADACVIDITMANAMTGEGTSYAELGYALELSTEEYGVSFRKDSDITAKFNEVLAQYKADGTLDKLAEKYSLTIA
ncbi:MAG: transporter substrate-binding domain-containing protein [Acutalibacteraceae bacterium]